ncbi:hypothetical protein GOP47_0004631 [Adiantum capillus-veneris]|uniref:Uncharacterized protein n=1 Tax=Adiantum capillus-veneris TaxID=13818 RepID=A0A9D4V885_ADICA|nr:hypothetical protein GOP47_0004631 [Adiantum capillus-veneris]
MEGDVLYVAPLRVVAPDGVSGPSQEDAGTSPPNGIPSDFLQFRMQADHGRLRRKPKSSAIRDYPDGCSPCMLSEHNHELKKPRISRQQDLSTQNLSNIEPPASALASQSKANEPTGKSTASVSSLKTIEEPELTEASHDDPEPPIVDSLPSIRRTKRIPPNLLSKLKASSRPPTKTSTFGLSHAAARKVIVETVRLFDAVRRNLLLQEDELKGNRLDLRVGNILTRNHRSLNGAPKRVGVIPGLEVGDIFYFRMELSCVGMHGPIQAGIDYLNAKETKYGDIVAISIISSGGYDAKDEGDELIYTGQGGKSGLDSKPMEDQKLERGNLAMRESMKHQLPVRVIRGVKDSTSPSGKTYTYDGLYKVDRFWSEKGKSGFEEFKFKLQRLPDQPGLGSAAIKLSEELKVKPSTRIGLKSADISGGVEAERVCVVNTMDDEVGPAPFKYTRTLEHLQRSSQAEKCACKNLCNSSKACSCLARNDNVAAYVNGLLVKERGVIYECGKNCKCSTNCANKATQRTSKLRFEVFKTQDRGWGVRCRDIIPAGTFVCEYTGRLVEDVASLQSKDYLLDTSRLSFHNPRWGDVSSLLSKEFAKAGNNLPRPSFAIDSSASGNMARFINHSCSPNLLVQCVFREGQDMRWPHAMLFAMDNIPPFRELTIDYGTSASCSGGQVQGKVCECKSIDCRGRFGY